MRCLDFVHTAHKIYGYRVSRVSYNSPCLESWDHTTTFTACRAIAYLEGAKSLRHGAVGRLFTETRRPLRTLGTGTAALPGNHGAGV